MSEKKIDLIAQLLAKAESTTPEEAEALTEHAERLMVKYMIDQSVIDARRAREGKTHEQIIQVPVRFEGTYRNDLLEMGAAVVWALGPMRILQSKLDRHTVMYIVGFESDVSQAEALVRSLHVQAMIALKSWWYEARDTAEYAYAPESHKRQSRRQFVRAFGQGAAARIRENRKSAVQDAGTGTELVLVDRKDQVNAYVNGLNLRPNRDKGSKFWDSNANTAGNVAGRNANTGERSVDRGRGLPAGV